MKKIITLFLIVFAVAACSSSQKQDENKKLYIEEGEYTAEYEESVQNERRGAKPVVESNYIFRVIPKDTYFYDEKNMPIDDVVKTASDYKDKRLWTRPKRYEPGEY